jgi:formate hydrogenlyase subunit 3/multisubunit Na+/H+ antiporter MnhD subunit
MSNIHKFEESPQLSKRPTGLMIGSIICSVLALGIFPPLFGGLAIFLGYQAYKRDSGIGQVCMIIGGIALIVGIIVGALWRMENLHF